MTYRISDILEHLEKDIEAGKLVDKFSESIERALRDARMREVNLDEEIEGDVEIGSLEEAEFWIDKHGQGRGG